MGDKWTTNDCNSGMHVLNRSGSICTLFSYSFSCSYFLHLFLICRFFFLFFYFLFFLAKEEKALGSSAFFLFICYHFPFSSFVKDETMTHSYNLFASALDLPMI